MRLYATKPEALAGRWNPSAVKASEWALSTLWIALD